MPPEPSPFAFSQIAEMNSTPADIPIPELENLRRGLAPAFAPTQQLSGQEETARALEKMRDFQARTVVQGKMNEGAIPPNSMTVNTEKGTLDIKGLSIDTYQAIMRDREELNNIRGSFAQEAARLQAQETQARSQPWAQLATALSANLAQAKDMPGWVQAAGRTAAQLNPTADQLRNQRLAVLGQQAQVSEHAGTLDIAAARTLEETAMRNEMRLERQGAAKEKTAKDVQLEENRRRDDFKATVDKVDQDVFRTRAFTPLQEKAVRDTGTSLGRSEKEIQNQVDRLRSSATESVRLHAEDRKERLTDIAAGKNKPEIDEALDFVAKGLAAGDLTSIRSISSLRGDQRLLLYSKVKKLNPDFNTAEVDRKVKMVDSFTNGKDGQGLQSFDTFLQHAGEVTDTLKNVEQSNVPAFNKPMNWWKKNMAGTPEYQRLIVSLEPVGKEFEKFLLNQQALYVDDRKQIETMLNGNSSPAQIMAALNQMGKTAQDRFGAANQRYKRVMKQDIDHPFSPEAMVGAAKIGINIPSGGDEATVSGPAPGARDSGGPRQKVQFAQGFEEYVKKLPPGKWAKDPATGRKFTVSGGQLVEVP